MTQPITASVIVVSRNRAAALVRCLKGLAQQDHPQFEIIVVADPDGVKATQTIGLPIKTVAFDQANISAARNAGLAIAAAPVVVFIDDDAVGEPTWLSRLTAPFIDPQVIAATGFVLGRNGFSFQWQACFVNALGQDQPVAITKTTLLGGTAELAVKTQGTNCAFRKSSLLAIGGFDPAYRFFWMKPMSTCAWPILAQRLLCPMRWCITDSRPVTAAVQTAFRCRCLILLPAPPFSSAVMRHMLI